MSMILPPAAPLSKETSWSSDGHAIYRQYKRLQQGKTFYRVGSTQGVLVGTSQERGQKLRQVLSEVAWKEGNS